jgi:hypothetical protein
MEPGYATDARMSQLKLLRGNFQRADSMRIHVQDTWSAASRPDMNGACLARPL